MKKFYVLASTPIGGGNDRFELIGGRVVGLQDDRLKLINLHSPGNILPHVEGIRYDSEVVRLFANGGEGYSSLGDHAKLEEILTSVLKRQEDEAHADSVVDGKKNKSKN